MRTGAIGETRRRRCASSAASISAARDGAANADGILQVLARRQITLERRLVAEIGELGMELVARCARRRAAPEHLPFFGIEQPGDGAHQRGLAGAVLAR